MKIVLQRVAKASVKVNQEVVGKIEKGLLLFIGIEENDEKEDAEWLGRKVLGLRVFNDEDGKINLSVQDIKGEILCISQFTLIADYKKGNRPSFVRAAKPEKALVLFDYFKEIMYLSGLEVQSGVFGADMKVDLLNDGPLTIVMDSKIR